jgi:diguanylate cyclase (GGDEF)-like protein
MWTSSKTPAPRSAVGTRSPASTKNPATRLGETRRLLAVCLMTMVLLTVVVISVVFYATGYINDTMDKLERARAQSALSFVLERGETLDTAMVARLALEQGLTGAQLVPLDAVAPGQTKLPLLDGSGRALVWTSRQLGTEILVTLAPMRICASILFFLVVGFLLRRLYVIASELEARRREAHDLARRDPLTKLGNRLAFDETIAEALAARKPVGLISLDLDDFKAVNDTLGHGAGDELLQLVAVRLGTCGRADDLVARIGGDEFTLVRPYCRDKSELIELAADIHTAMATPFTIGSNCIDVHVSVGSALAPHDGPDATTLLRNADLALYRAKRTARHPMQVDRLRIAG